MLVFNIDFNISDNLLQKKMIQFAETKAVTDNIAKEYVISLLLEDENVLSEICGEGINPGRSLRAAASDDLTKLIKIMKKMSDNLPGSMFDNYERSVKRNTYFEGYRQSIEYIVSKDDCAEILEAIISHYSNFGGGPFSKYTAFKWENGLKGVKTPDGITLGELFCLEEQKQVLTENTVSFLRGLTANNVLLYGESGCGKSSVVKALLNEYYKDGLRMVEISKDDFYELPILIDALRDKKLSYIIFLDDLSFENNDLRYKALKTILEGSMQKQPQNILFYATSNRFHIVNETWDQRQGEDIHVSDTKNEKLSLSERFGIRISFFSPNQEEYLKITEGILSQKNIEFTDELKAEALKWALLYNGRSGRTAAQFASSILAGKMLKNS